MITSIVEVIKLGRDKDRRERRRTRKEELAAKKKLGLLREGAGIPGNRIPAPRDGQFSAVEELRLLNLRIREDVFEVRSCIRRVQGQTSLATAGQHAFNGCNLLAFNVAHPRACQRCGLRGTWLWADPTATGTGGRRTSARRDRCVCNGALTVGILNEYELALL